MAICLRTGCGAEAGPYSFCNKCFDPGNVRHETAAHTGDHEPILQFFGFAHLPENMQNVSKPFHDMAHGIVVTCPKNPERTVALRKLLEAKDAAVRSVIFKATGA